MLTNVPINVPLELMGAASVRLNDTNDMQFTCTAMDPLSAVISMHVQ